MSYTQEQRMEMAAAQRASMYSMGPLGPQPTTLSPRMPTPIDCEIQGLSEILGTLHKRFSQIEDRLNPVLHQRGDKPLPGTAACPTPATGVPMADQLRSLFDTAASLRDRMDDMIERIAV